MITIENTTPLQSELVIGLESGNHARILYIGGTPAAIRIWKYLQDYFYWVKKPLWKKDMAYTEAVMEAFPEIANIREDERDDRIFRFARVKFDYEVMKTIRAGVKPDNYRER